MKADWKPISTAPKDGKCLLAILTDEGWEYGVLERRSDGVWIHEGEPTYSHGYYYDPKFWTELPENEPDYISDREREDE
jgi:hypothetical protein